MALHIVIKNDHLIAREKMVQELALVLMAKWTERDQKHSLDVQTAAVASRIGRQLSKKF